VIPWSTLVRHAPMILAAADRLLARAGTSKANDTVANETAQLLHELAEQVTALTAMQDRTAKRARLAVALSIAALALAAGTLLFVVLS
jgi:hypothetical protein